MLASGKLFGVFRIWGPFLVLDLPSWLPLVVVVLRQLNTSEAPRDLSVNWNLLVDTNKEHRHGLFDLSTATPLIFTQLLGKRKKKIQALLLQSLLTNSLNIL